MDAHGARASVDWLARFAARVCPAVWVDFGHCEGKRIFHNPFTQVPWNSSDQIRDPWRTVLKRAGVRYRNPYQMRHTYASMILSAGENM